MALPSDPYTFTDGATADADEVNARFAALFAALAAGGLDAEALASQAWTAYTPTFTAATLGTGGTNVARSMKLGRTVHANGVVTLGTGGVFTGSDVTWTAPYTAANTHGQIGSSYGYDSSAVDYAAGVCTITPNTTTMRARLGDTTPETLGATQPWTWAAGDLFYWAITYEAAS